MPSIKPVVSSRSYNSQLMMRRSNLSPITSIFEWLFALPKNSSNSNVHHLISRCIPFNFQPSRFNCQGTPLFGGLPRRNRNGNLPKVSHQGRSKTLADRRITPASNKALCKFSVFTACGWKTQIHTTRVIPPVVVTCIWTKTNVILSIYICIYMYVFEIKSWPGPFS